MVIIEDHYVSEETGKYVTACYNSEGVIINHGRWHWVFTLYRGEQEIDQLRSINPPEFMAITLFCEYNKATGLSGKITHFIHKTKEGIRNEQSLGS